MGGMQGYPVSRQTDSFFLGHRCWCACPGCRRASGGAGGAAGACAARKSDSRAVMLRRCLRQASMHALAARERAPAADARAPAEPAGARAACCSCRCSGSHASWGAARGR